MWTFLSKISPKAALGYLRPLHRAKSPNLAAFIGFLLGGFGLGIYFLSFIDAIIPLAITVALSIVNTEVAEADPYLGVWPAPSWPPSTGTCALATPTHAGNFPSDSQQGTVSLRPWWRGKIAVPEADSVGRLDLTC